MADIADIEGIGPAYAQKLKDAGVGTVEKLLSEGGRARAVSGSPFRPVSGPTSSCGG